MELMQQNLTMSSREIADLTGSRHDSVKRSIDRMQESNIIQPTPTVEVNSQGQEVGVYNLCKRDSLVVVAQLSPEFTAAIVDRWQELEGQKQFQIPQTLGEALQLAADQAKQLELQAPKVAFVDNLVNRDNLLTATQIGQKHGLSAIKLNKILTELGVYSAAVKRTRAFKQWFIDRKFGEIKKTEQGFDQALFTNAGEIWINEKLITEGIV